MFHVEHSDVASDNFFAKIPILPIRHKNCAIRDFTPYTYQLLHLFFKSVFRGGFEGRFFLRFRTKNCGVQVSRTPQKKKNHLPNDFT